jgi:arginine/lysine/ornithine decarboxylase
MFVTPYPPGFPILVPRQVVTAEIPAFMSALDTREIHGWPVGHFVELFEHGVIHGATLR